MFLDHSLTHLDNSSKGVILCCHSEIFTVFLECHTKELSILGNYKSVSCKEQASVVKLCKTVDQNEFHCLFREVELLY